MRNPERTKNVSRESTPPAVKYPACTEIANQIVKPRQPSSAGQYGRLVRVGVSVAGVSITVSPIPLGRECVMRDNGGRSPGTTGPSVPFVVRTLDPVGRVVRSRTMDGSPAANDTGVRAP